MTEQFSSRKPRFNPGDRVRPVGPTAGPDPGGPGQVTEIFGPPQDAVYRYRVSFAGGNSGVFFGFELEADDSQSVA